mgnify:CR=1 FL=1
MRDVFRVSLIAVLVALASPHPVHAYIDPLSGSIIFQVIAAAVLGASLTIKRFWRRIFGLFRRSAEADGDGREG